MAVASLLDRLGIFHGPSPDRGANPDSANLDELTAIEFVHLMNAEDGKVVPAVASQAEAVARAIEVIAERHARGAD